MNIASVILYMYPNANPSFDFIVQDDGEGQYIAQWNLPDPQPTLDLLQSKWVETLREIKIKQFKNIASQELTKTDYKVIRHRDQLDIGVSTTLTNEQYQQLLINRNNIRIKSNDLEAQVNSATVEDEINLITW